MEKERTLPNRRENRFMTNLMVVLQTLSQDRDPAVRRLTEYGYRHAARDVGLLISLVDRLQAGMLETMPPRRLDYYKRMTREAQIVIDFPGPVPRSRGILLDVRDLAALYEAALRGECALCMKDGREIRDCPLRDAMLAYAPPAEISRVGCEFREPASQLVRGNDVSF